MKSALPASPRHRAPYRIRGERVWACIRARYLAGESAPALAVEFDVSVYAIRRRITREGWSKQGLAEAEAEAMAGVNDCRHPSACAARPEDPAAGASPTLSRTPTVDTGWADRSPAAPPGPPVGAADAAGRRMTTVEDPPLEPRAAARAALDEAVRLLRSGRLGAAEAAARVADVMGRAAARLEVAEPAAEDAGVDEAAFEAVRRKVLGLDTAPSPSGDGRETVFATDCRHPSACAARPEDPAAGASPTLSRTPMVDTGWADRSPAAPLGPPVGAADAAGRRMTTVDGGTGC